MTKKVKKYKTINGWTKAAMIDQIKKHMFDHKSYDERLGACCYLAPDGNKCAVGCFIPDGHEAQTSEATIDTDAVDLLSIYPALRRKMPINLDGLCEMQKIHDSTKNENPRPALYKWIRENVLDR